MDSRRNCPLGQAGLSIEIRWRRREQRRIKKALDRLMIQRRFVSLSTAVKHCSAQSKLSREHLLKRSTQKPMFQLAYLLSPRREV